MTRRKYSATRQLFDDAPANPGNRREVGVLAHDELPPRDEVLRG